MPAALRIDTLKFAKRLTDAGFTREGAEAIVEGLSEADLSELSTKAELRAEMSALGSGLRAEITALRGEMKASAAELKADLYRGLWVSGLGIVGLTVALLKLLP